MPVDNNLLKKLHCNFLLIAHGMLQGDSEDIKISVTAVMLANGALHPIYFPHPVTYLSADEAFAF